MKANYLALIKSYPKLKEDESLAKHSTFGIGGSADLFYLCQNTEELPELIQETVKLKIPYFLIGGGSNVLFDSAGFRGLIIKVIDISTEIQGSKVIAASGVKMTGLAKETMRAELTGFEWADGLPGSLGGAIYGNAGCHDHEIAENLEEVTLYSPDKGIFTVDKNYLKFQYRSSHLKYSKEIILKATLQLKKGQADFTKSQSANQFRSDNQPWGYTNGSFFKNPAGDSAGRLIDQAGLKGKQIGGAQISPKHANFFMNIDNASSEDILALRDLAKAEVKCQFGITLEEEVIIVPSQL